MRKMVLSLSVAATAVLVGLVAYDLLAIQPYQQEIDGVIARVQPHGRPPSEITRKVAIAAHGGNWLQIKSFAVSTLMRKLGIAQGKGMLSWHVHSSLWMLLLPRHYDDQKLFAIWCALIPNGSGTGLNDAALALYGKNLDVLNLEQIATLMVLAKNSRYFISPPDDTEVRVRHVVHRFREMYGKDAEKTLSHNQ